METNEDISPGLENQFLKNVLAFEESYEKADFVTMYERMGKPEFVPAETLDHDKLKTETRRLLELLSQSGIVDFLRRPL